jgi:1-acyl-sn-glycerol-3-phosphate acyltransferase
MITIKHIRDVKFDENYEYIDKRFRFRLMRGIYWLLVNCIVFPVCRISHGLKIHGSKNFKKHKKEFKNGAITISNHVFYWDYLCVLKAIRPHLAYFPAWQTNFEGPNRGLIRLSGGIPVPTDSFRAMIKFNRAMEEILESGKWLHFFPEGSMWFFYPDIRPLKKAVFTYAVRFDKPIIPITMSFRPRKGITKLFSKTPCVDLHIGEPLHPKRDLSPKDAADELHARAYHIMQVMNGINPGDPNYNTDQNIANYRKTM